MVVTKEEWIDWKRNPVTEAFYAACVERIADGTDIVVSSAGLDPINDNYMRGFIQAYKEMLEFKIEDLGE